MNPEREIAELKKRLATLEKVLDLSFIESAKRRIVQPEFERINIAEALSKNTTGNTSGILQAVEEGGSATYSVAKAFNSSITIEDIEGNTYKIGVYTP